jgi:hypothetical protein
MALLKVAVTKVLIATPVTAGLRANGAVALTLGASAVPLLTPKMGSLLPPQALMSKADEKTNTQVMVLARKVEGCIRGLLSRCSEKSEEVKNNETVKPVVVEERSTGARA